MRDFAHIITAAALIVHAMIGCCHCHWHEETCQTAEVKQPECCCCHHAAAPEEPSPSSTPCGGESACQGVCNYLPTHKPPVDHGDAQHNFVPFLCMSSQTGISGCTDVEFLRTHPQFGASPPHLRLHLLNQTLLI